MALSSQLVNVEVEVDGKANLLKSPFTEYRIALNEFIDDLLTDKVEPKNPIELWQQKFIRMTNDTINKCSNYAETFSLSSWLDIDDKTVERHYSLDRQFVNRKKIP